MIAMKFPETLRSRTQAFIAVIAFVGLLSGAFMYGFIRASLRDGYSSQTVLVPFISLYLVWQKRDTIFSQLDFPPGSGIAIFSTGLATFFGGSLLSAGYFLAMLKLVGVLLMVAGAFICFFGTKAFRSARFPFSLLLLMLPLPASVIDSVVVFLQSESTALSYRLFSFLGIPVFRDGFVLTLPGIAIEVAKECSGINSSVALLLTALLVAHQTLRQSSRRVILVLLMVPLSIVKNAVRIVSLTLLAIYVDPSFLSGRLHHDGGIVFFLIALALVYPIWRALQKSESGLSRQIAAVEPLTGGTLVD